MHGFERDRNIFLTRAQEAANADNERYYLSGLVDQNILDIADLVFVRIVEFCLYQSVTVIASLGRAVCILALG